MDAEMTDIVERLREVQRLRGDTFSSYEIIGMIGQAAAEIVRLRRELNLLRAVHENAEAEVRQLLDENGS